MFENIFGEYRYNLLTYKELTKISLLSKNHYEFFAYCIEKYPFESCKECGGKYDPKEKHSTIVCEERKKILLTFRLLKRQYPEVDYPCYDSSMTLNQLKTNYKILFDRINEYVVNKNINHLVNLINICKQLVSVILTHTVGYSDKAVKHILLNYDTLFCDLKDQADIDSIKRGETIERLAKFPMTQKFLHDVFVYKNTNGYNDFRNEINASGINFINLYQL